MDVSAKGNYLFPEIDAARYGESRRQKRLILPRLLDRESRSKIVVDSDAFARAHAIVCRWADLESQGKLHTRTESNLEGEFIGEVFGEALGYKRFSENLPRWEIEQKFSVNGGIADAAIGRFEQGRRVTPRAVIELKGPRVNVDRDRFDGRTAVQQCWDYLNALPECPWGIVCNYVSFRLYHRNHTPRVFERFTLQELRKPDVFAQFYCLFQHDGLLVSAMRQEPRADVLLEASVNREREVGDRLYNEYHANRIRLIQYLMMEPHNKSLERAIYIAQRLLDRVIFIAFCEDRDLLPRQSLKRAADIIAPFARATNPKWQNFLNLFRSVDKGNPQAGISPYNGGLFRAEEEVDDLELDDEHTTMFRHIGEYDFQHEVNVDVLGHLFERSVHDVERIRTGGLFGEIPNGEKGPKMGKSAERKRFGIYYTPQEFTEFITYNTIERFARERFDALAANMGLTRMEAEAAEEDARARDYWQKCLGILRAMKVVDPACGSGAFLIQAYDVLEHLYVDVLEHFAHQGVDIRDLREAVPDMILHDNIHGVDLSPEAVEITQLALWLRSANRGKTLADLSHNIVCGNSLVSDRAVHPRAMKWEEAFPEVFGNGRSGFDCVIGNPPWERMKLQEREFFDGRDDKIAAAVSAARRRELIEQLKEGNPELYARYAEAGSEAEANLAYIRACGEFPLTGKGDINTYAVFAELARRLVDKDGMVGLLVPSGIATDNTTKDFFSELVENKSLGGLYDFENRRKIFSDVDGRFKFSVLLFGGENVKHDSMDFVFFAHEMEEVRDDRRHVALTPEDIRLLNPNTHTCPVFRSSRDAEITKAIYRRAPVLWDRSRKHGGNPWGIKFVTMFHQTNDAELFRTGEELQSEKFKRVGANWTRGKKIFVPLYEAKMIQMYDHRAASVVVKDENWMRQGQTVGTPLVSHQNPEYTVEPRWWVDDSAVEKVLKERPPFFVGFKDITSPTNQRTMIAAAMPFAGVTNHFVLVRSSMSAKGQMCLLANLNSFALDFVIRQKIGGVTLNFFLVEQFPIFTPDFYGDRCAWNRRQTLETWISERVLKLTCTSDDMRPLAEAAGFAEGVHKWKDAERAKLMAELDAAYFLLYGIERDDVEYILSTFSGVMKEGEALLNGTGTAGRILKWYDEFRETARSG